MKLYLDMAVFFFNYSILLFQLRLHVFLQLFLLPRQFALKLFLENSKGSVMTRLWDLIV